MRIPFRFRPQFNTCFVAEEASLTPDVGAVSPGAESGIADSTDSSAVGETFGAQPEQVAGSVTTPNETETVPDIFDGIPSLEQLQTEVEQKVPYAEGLLRLRTELERVRPEIQQYEPWKPIVEAHDPARVQERLQAHESFFSPLVRDGQPVLDDRGLPQTTAHPFLQQMEAKQPGYAVEHLVDVMGYQVTNPQTGQPEYLFNQVLRDVLGLDPGRLDQYRNIDTLIAKSNGNITSEELNSIPEPEREAYKTLPQSIRNSWDVMDAEERQYHLETARERLESRRFREELQSAQEKQEAQERQKFEAEVQESFVQDLTGVRERAFDSLRDNLARQWQPSTDDAINQDRYDDVLAPLVHLIDPDLQPMALKRLEREGIKVNAQEFNQNMSALVGARQTFVRAKAYGDTLTAERAEQDFNRLHTQLMHKFHTIALQRAQKYGYQAQKIAESKGELLKTASQVRPTVPGATAAQQFNASGLPQGMDPRSAEAAMYHWKQSQTG